MFSLTSEYALRALAGLACSANDETILTRTLSSIAGVPHGYLSKILGALTKAGILHSSPGRGGGYQLARAAEEIALIDVVELFDGIKSRPGCLFEGGRECSDENPCIVHEDWKAIREGYIEFLESKTIADIADPGGVDDTLAGGLRPREAGGRG